MKDNNTCLETTIFSLLSEFLKLSLELLEHCYKIDDDYTQQLLTYELKNFSEQTCLGLAVIANHRPFIAHTCCQVLLNDLWIGGLRMRKNTSLKVSLALKKRRSIHNFREIVAKYYFYICLF